MGQKSGQVHYSIWTPNGNITALAEGVTETKDRADVFAGIMKRHPEVEQVGFVRLSSDPSRQPFDIDLQMAGGEFCGNASMCASALFLLRNSVPADSDAALIRLRVSGTASPVSVRIRQEEDGSFFSSILMPPPVNIEEKEFVLG
ncbi:MAG: hypothetical protein IKP86_02885, partial [Anaerolineaceae bacterium]|nr:hypothetical protein [Anaerolineaceae bacterium]